MRNMLKNFFYLSLGLNLMVGCSLLQPDDQAIAELASLQNQRSANAILSMLEIEEIDTLIKLDNRWLAYQFETILKSRAALGKNFTLRKFDTSFTNQIILIKSLVDISDQYGNTISATLYGDISLKYKGNGLEWRPRFSQLHIKSEDFTFAKIDYEKADSELTQILLQNLNSDIAQAVVNDNKNSIPINPVPLGEIQVGASLPGFSESPARATRSLKGVFMIAGSAIMIDSKVTSIALDMSFIPELSTCPADVTVSRSMFVRDIESREPVGITRSLSSAANVRYFYSEIEGAEHPLTIIHYWFADGLPIAVEELTIGPSERWRTWSSKGAANSDATKWEVLVVEKETGCILASNSIRTLESETLITSVSQAQARQTFEELQETFSKRTSGFSIVNEKPGVALIEVRRPFLQNVLQASLADLSIDAEFGSSGLSVLNSSAQLQAFDAHDVICEHQDCSPAPVCKTSLTQCKRLRDTRDCSSCQFRNPLNNRCVSEAIDPLCEAARNRQNIRYDIERAACITRAENAKRSCDQLNAQVLRSCQIESGFEVSACESVKSRLKTFSQGTPVASVSARTQANGRLTATFSNLEIGEDLESLKLDLSLQSEVQLEGELEFKPTGVAQPLDKCIAAWSAPFRTRFTSTPVINSLLSRFEQKTDMLTAQWSGFGISIDTHPSPLESMFVDNPQLLANCKIGLTVDRVKQAIAGEDAEFFRGHTELVIQPLPTRIHLAPATIEFENMVYSAEGRLSAQHLRYDIQE